ncbi:MAG: ABC transporter permease [Rhodanobacteraceae bacterium]
MLSYYLDLALRSLKRNTALTALMVLAIALGIGASMTTLTVLHVLSGDPLPQRSDKVYRPQLDPQDMRGMGVDMGPGTEPPMQVTLVDGRNLLHAGRADRQALMTGGSVPVQPRDASLAAFFVPSMYTSADFFAMFGVPFQYGHGWSAADDAAHARVVVISAELNQKLFGGADSVGRDLRIAGKTFRIAGVIDNWRPNLHFYNLSAGTYRHYDQVFVPLDAALDLALSRNGSTNCWGNGSGGVGRILPSDTCTWLQFWVELDNPAKAAAYRQFLVNYSQQQHALGRFERAPNVRLRNLTEWLDYRGVVPQDVRMQTWLAFGFLLVCLLNTVGLMLAKFLRRAGELSVRRALGASRRALFGQLLVESGVVGIAGGVLGLGLALLGLWLVRSRPSNYAAMAHLDGAMLLTTFVLALLASLVAGTLPAWRACRVMPALQLKSN